MATGQGIRGSGHPTATCSTRQSRSLLHAWHTVQPKACQQAFDHWALAQTGMQQSPDLPAAAATGVDSAVLSSAPHPPHQPSTTHSAAAAHAAHIAPPHSTQSALCPCNPKQPHSGTIHHHISQQPLLIIAPLLTTTPPHNNTVSVPPRRPIPCPTAPPHTRRASGPLSASSRALIVPSSSGTAGSSSTGGNC